MISLWKYLVDYNVSLHRKVLPYIWTLSLDYHIPTSDITLIKNWSICHMLSLPQILPGIPLSLTILFQRIKMVWFYIWSCWRYFTTVWHIWGLHKTSWISQYFSPRIRPLWWKYISSWPFIHFKHFWLCTLWLDIIYHCTYLQPHRPCITHPTLCMAVCKYHQMYIWCYNTMCPWSYEYSP